MQRCTQHRYCEKVLLAVQCVTHFSVQVRKLANDQNEGCGAGSCSTGCCIYKLTSQFSASFCVFLSPLWFFMYLELRAFSSSHLFCWMSGSNAPCLLTLLSSFLCFICPFHFLLFSLPFISIFLSLDMMPESPLVFFLTFIWNLCCIVLSLSSSKKNVCF